jgi:MFS family permease
MFILYEHIGQKSDKIPQPLTPTHIFTASNGREFTAPFIVGFVVTMFYYMINICYPTQIAVFFTDATTPLSTTLLYSLPANLGLVAGEILLIIFGTWTGKVIGWKWALTASVCIMVFFGALLALGNPDRKVMMMVFVCISQIGFGWAQMMSIAFIQMGVPQIELGISGGLAGVSRFAGGAIAISVYTTILTNVQTSWAARLLPPAVIAAGLPASSVAALAAALPLGEAALGKVPGISPAAIAAAGGAIQQSYVHGLKVMTLSSLSFGIVAIIACVLCNDIGHKVCRLDIVLGNLLTA